MSTDSDPNQTFAGAPPPRKRGPLGPLLIAVTLVVGIGLIIAWTLNRYLPPGTFSLSSLTGKKPGVDPVPNPSPSPTPARVAEASPSPTSAETPAATAAPTPAVAETTPAPSAAPTPALPETLEASPAASPGRTPAVVVAPPTPRPVATPAPSPTVVARAETTPVPTPPKIDAGSPGAGDAPFEPPAAGAPPELPTAPPAPAEKASVREEVLKRIDLMPDLKPDDRDKLYRRVDRNQGMERLSTIAFDLRDTRPRPADVDRLRQELSTPAARRFLDDPTVVIVVLGYADPAGTPEANKALSDARAKATIATLRSQLRINSVMHGVGMGASTLFGEGRNQRNRNRLVEIWAVLP